MKRYIGCNNLLIPSLSRKFPIAKERTTDFAVCTITTNNVVTLEGHLAIGSLASNASMVGILLDPNNFVRPEDLSSGLFRDMIDKNLAKLVQWQASHVVGVVFVKNPHLDSGKISAVNFPPADAVRGETPGTNIVNDPRLAEFLNSGGSVMRRSRLSVQFIAHINQRDMDVFFGESQTEKQSRRTCADDDHLI